MESSPDCPSPKVTLLTYTRDPLETVFSVWEASKTEKPLRSPSEIARDVPRAEIEELFRAVIAQRIPIGEHVDFVFMLENVSVSWREQAVRHRIGVNPSPERLGSDIVVDRIPDLSDSSFWSQSMRIQNMGAFARRGAYRLPRSIRDHELSERLEGVYRDTMFHIEAAYNILVKAGIPMEDAREVIPLGAHHRISWKLNIAALQHIIGKRGCVTGDTKIALLDGRTRTMKELLCEYGTGKSFWVYSCDDDGRVVPGLARHNGVTQVDAELVEVILDNGSSIRATPDHRFMTRDGGYKRADGLVAGDSLMPLYRDVSDGKSERPQDRIEGYERVYHPGVDDWEFTHRATAPKSEPQGTKATVVHHVDFDKRNNSPDNLVRMGYRDHIRLHSTLTANLSSEEQSRRAKLAPREVRVAAGKIAASKGVLGKNSERAAEANRGNKERGRRISESLKRTLATPEARARRSELAKRQWENPEVRDMMRKAISAAKSGRADGAKTKGAIGSVGANHKVVEVRRIAIREDVYDLSVDDYHNYATDAGVFVHNCWILQLGIWGPVIEGMINELATKVHPIFRELVTPPCIKGDDFKGCVFMEENRRRYSGEDALPPCPLHANYHELPMDEGTGVESGMVDARDSVLALDIPMKEEMAARAEEYRGFWNRDPYNGKRLRK